MSRVEFDLVKFGEEIDWEPRRLVFPGPWAGHIPFAFWLVKVARPSVLVELGTHSGNSYSAFCQAIEAFGLPTEAFAVDTWEGDPQTGFYGADVLADLATFNERHFASFSTLVRKSFREARAEFGSRRIDVLHIDGAHGYDAVRADFVEWRDLLSERGVVLFHDTNVREPGFGVRKLWEELAAQHPSLEFLHSNGLGVLGVGADLPPELSALFELAKDPDALARIRRRFSLRGQTFTERAEVIARDRTLAELRSELDASRESGRRLEARAGELETLLESRDERTRQLEEHALQEREFIKQLRSAERVTTERLIRLDRELRSAHQGTLRFSDELRAVRAEAAQIRDTFARSTSWRITAPLRKATALLRGEALTTDQMLTAVTSTAATAADTQATKAFGTEREADRGGDFKSVTRTLMTERLRGVLGSRTRLRLPSSPEPDVSILLVLYNQAELTYGCLASITESLAQSDLKVEVVILDNGSTDATPKLLERIDGAVVVRSDSNLHFLRGVNRAADEARGRHILLLNNDAQLIPGALEAAVRTLDDDASIGAVGGRIILPDGTLQEAGSIVWKDGSCVGYARGRPADASEAMFRRDVDYCSGAFLLTPRALFEKLNRFDEAYAPAYYEETDYCLRIWEAGLRVVFDPSVAILHFEFGSSTRSGDALELQKRNHEVFRQKHRHWLERQPTPGTNPHDARSAGSQAKRILFIEDRVPKPDLGAGYPRANDIIQAFERQGAHVTLFPMFQHDESWEGVRRCIPPGVEVVLEGEAALLGAFLRERAGCFDAIFVSRPHNMQVLRDALDREPTLRGDALLIYDAEALFAPRDALKAEILGSPLGAAEVQARLESEVSLVRGSDLVLSVSPLERDLFRKKGVADVRLLGHAVEIDPTEAPFGKRPDFLFLGAVHDDDSPNADSILWFARDVLPYIRRELGQSVRLKVVGLVQAPAVLELDGVDLELLGRLDDVRPAFETARVVVIPTRYAAGIPHKAHHAASLGVPIVATELIARQLGWQDGRDLMASSDALGFAQACIELYRNETLWTELRTQSIERVREDCSEGAFDRSIRDVLTLVTEPAAKRPAGENSDRHLYVQRDPAHDVSAALPFGFAEASQAAPASVAAVVHLFYPELATEFRSYLENLPPGSDVFVSTDTADKQAEIEVAFAGFAAGRVEVRVMPNRGRDIAPKLVGFADVHDRYEFVLHLHSKASHHDRNLSVWRTYLLESLAGSPEIVANYLWAMQAEPDLGLMFPQHFDYVRRWIDWRGNLPGANALLARMGRSLSDRRAIDFPSGSMFWARSRALRPLLDLNLRFEDFPEEGDQKDLTPAHAIERLYAVVAEIAGLRWMKVARPELLANQTGIVALRDRDDFRRFVAERTVRITGSDPMPVMKELYSYEGETPPALAKAAAGRS